MRSSLGWLLALGLALSGSARAAEPVTLRLASVVPDGTAWARELKAFAREVHQLTDGRVLIKWSLGGIAGDDIEAAARIARGQLDGVGAGAWQCERWAPSIKVTRLPGLFRSREESRHVAGRLRAVLDDEYRKSGFVYLGDSQVGPSMIFTRNPVKTFDELRRVRLWSLDNDETKRRLLSALGLNLASASFARSRPMYDEGQVDGFLAPPSGALAFQWSTQARHLIDLTTDHIYACVVVTARAFDALSLEDQRTIRAGAAKFVARFDDVGATADRELIGGLFERQGVRVIRPDAAFRAAFDAAARAVWDADKQIPQALIQQVQGYLASYRAQKEAVKK
ncbi:MAG TPA: TRAP transporter substrate-binding protein DctP [Kofleriaceae bacterium]|nr:TRAP transporter substrate-binding protein DctP [Kofleriaceae bacterium]